MLTFTQWVADKYGHKLGEAGKRTALSANYPSLYHSIRQQPRQAWMPISATAGLADKQIKDPKVSDGGPNVTDKKENPYKDFYNTENYSESARQIEHLWNMFVQSPEGEGFDGFDLETITKRLRDPSSWKLKATINSDIHAALGEAGQALIDHFTTPTMGGNVGTRPEGDVFKPTRASGEMMSKPHWQR